MYVAPHNINEKGQRQDRDCRPTETNWTAALRILYLYCTVRGGDIVIQATSCSSAQDISHILVNAKVHYVLTGTGHLNVF